MALNISGDDRPMQTNEPGQNQLLVGFFPKPGHFNGEFIAAAAAAAAKGSTKSSADGRGLHGATKTGAKKRMAALRKSLKAEEKQKKKGKQADNTTIKAKAKAKSKSKSATKKRQRKAAGANATVESNVEPGKASADVSKDDVSEGHVVANDPANRHNDSPEAKDALNCYRNLMGIKDTKTGGDGNSKEPLMLPGQTVYAGCKPAREVRYGTLSEGTRQLIPSALAEALGLDIDPEDAPVHAQSQTRRRLYCHQAAAVESILNGHHTTICTGTGSGKSLCFLLPVLSMVMKTDIDAVTASAFSSSNDEVVGGAAAIIMFPTKALAQDQYTKLMGLINSHPLLVDHIRVGVIDGDTPHSSRADIVKHSNIILTNPDTIHAAILPNWKRTYAPFLAKVRHVVIDESHMYEGAFGGHVSLVLARLVRICAAAFYKRCDDLTEEQKPTRHFGLAESRSDATLQLNALTEAGLIHHVLREHAFKDENLFYRFSLANEIKDSLEAFDSLGRTARGPNLIQLSALVNRFKDVAGTLNISSILNDFYGCEDESGWDMSDLDNWRKNMKRWGFGRQEDQDDEMVKRLSPLLLTVDPEKWDVTGDPEWESPWGILAQIALFDQISRSAFRGTPRAFAWDELAERATKVALERGYFETAYKSTLNQFVLLLPLEHSEDWEDQKLGVSLLLSLLSTVAVIDEGYTDYEIVKRLEFSKRLSVAFLEHAQVIAKFGRYPHRNRAQGRHTTLEERIWLASDLVPRWAKSQNPEDQSKLSRAIPTYTIPLKKLTRR